MQNNKGVRHFKVSDTFDYVICIMNVLYDLIFVLYAVFYIPIFLFKRRRRKGIALRFGIYPRELIERLKSKKNIYGDGLVSRRI